MTWDVTPEDQELMAEVDAYRKAWCRCGRPYQEHWDGPMEGAASSQLPCAKFTPTSDIGPPETVPWGPSPSVDAMEKRLHAYVHRAAAALEARGLWHRAACIRALAAPEAPTRRRRR